MVLLCLGVFTIELILLYISERDYRCSFMFCLDVVSLLTLVLDHSYVGDAITVLASGGSGGDVENGNLQSARAARVAAKASRIVRIIRLMRLCKLQRQLTRQKKSHFADIPDPFDSNEDHEDEDAENLGESQVGKKLVERTTRCVVFVVITSLLISEFSAGEPEPTFFSAVYGSYGVARSLSAVLANTTSRESYEKEFLRIMAYHNWFARDRTYSDSFTTPSNYYANVFWFGIASSTPSTLEGISSVARIQRGAVEQFLADVQREGQIDGAHNYGYMPPGFASLLSSPWNTQCFSGAHKQVGVSLLSSDIIDVGSYALRCPAQLRSVEISMFSAPLLPSHQWNNAHVVFYADKRPYVKADALMHLISTFTICSILLIAAMIFSYDANMLVLGPIETMCKRVHSIRENPLVAVQMADKELLDEEMRKVEERNAEEHPWKKAQKLILRSMYCHMTKEAPMETLILEKTILKLASLLLLGFGEGGVHIVEEAMQVSRGPTNMIPGLRLDCIVGVARLQHFAIATEVLQGNIMTFVNSIAEIVHGLTMEYSGAVNKNTGEEFLVVWKNPHLGEDVTCQIAEMAICAFTKISAAVSLSDEVASYMSHPKFRNRLPDVGAWNNALLHFGLHHGWVIEGAVGSDFKIDVSYLSPNVEIVRNAEASTHIYGVSFVITEAVVKLCSPSIVLLLREIDRARFSESYADPMALYSMDLDYSNFFRVQSRSSDTCVWDTYSRMRAKRFMSVLKARALETDVTSGLLEDINFRCMREIYTEEFMMLFSRGYQNFIEGEWQVAMTTFLRTKDMLGFDDGPSMTLLEHMEAYSFRAPHSWQGFREISRRQRRTRRQVSRGKAHSFLE
eukprot:TRINITY_DN31488_c0_g1_i1.p1 TRINITY_DN31488_c0_g1~~TRINITY_DN31488_c0_g1_i1.p1  ORF type:complete len:852 (+),score=86.72 TRINITY_DN31488_c0_g1_i1:358-2913(+)